MIKGILVKENYKYQIKEISGTKTELYPSSKDFLIMANIVVYCPICDTIHLTNNYTTSCDLLSDQIGFFYICTSLFPHISGIYSAATFDTSGRNIYSAATSYSQFFKNNNNHKHSIYSSITLRQIR